MTTVRRALSVALGFLLLAGAAVAQQPANAPATAPLDARIPLDPAVTSGTLPNGIRYFIRETARPEDRGELRLVVDVGSIVEDADQLGLAHFVEHMAFNGTENFPKLEVTSFLESLGMRFGPSINASTSFDETVYMLEVPTDKPEVLDRAFLILEDWAHRITFDPEEVDKERGVVIEEWRGRRGAAARMQDEQLPILLAGSRYADRLPIGTVESLQTFEHGALVRFYRDWYRPELMTVIAAGDFDAADIEKRIQAHFAGIPRAADPRPRETYSVPDHDGTRFAIATDAEAPATFVTVLSKRDAGDTGTVGAYRKSLVEQLFAAMLSTRFGELAQKPDTPFINAGAGVSTLVGDVETTSLGAIAKDGAIAAALSALLTEAERVERFGFTPGEFERTKQNVTASFERAVNEKANVTASAIAGELVRHVTEGESVPGIDYEFALVQRFLPEITLAEINALAPAWAPDRNRIVMVSAPEKEGVDVPTETALRAALAAAENAETTAYVDTVDDAALIEALPEPGRIVDETAMEAHGITEWTLSNGAKVVLMPTDFKEDQIVFRATSPGGHSLASDDAFMSASNATAVAGAGGLGRFSAVDLPKVLAGRQASAGAAISEFSEDLAGGSSKDDVETLFQLIHLRFVAPRPDPEAYAVLAGRIKALLANQTATPAFAFGSALQSALRQDHPRARPFTAADVDAIDFETAMAFYRDRFADAGDFTFVFVGAFDLEMMRPLVEQYLASLPSSGRQETWKDTGVRYATGTVERRVEKGLEPQSRAALVFTGPFDYTQEAKVEIRAVADILETRLRESLREDLGGTYGVSVDVTYAKMPVQEHAIRVMFNAAPDRVDELLEQARKEIELLRMEGPSDAQVADTRAKLSRDLETNLKDNGFLASQLVSRYQLGEDVGSLFALDDYYARLTAAAIQNAAQRYLDPDDVVKVVLVPEGK